MTPPHLASPTVTACLGSVPKYNKAKTVTNISQEKKRRKRPETPDFLSCHVCGDRAGKHSYYGGQACVSCRVFFRRAFQSGYYLAYICIKDTKCEINLKSRKKCRYCRYQACLAAGMKTAWVLNEEEKKTREKRRSKIKQPAPQPGVFKKPAPPRSIRPMPVISDEEMLEVKQYSRKCGFFYDSKVKDMQIGLIHELIRYFITHSGSVFIWLFQAGCIPTTTV